MELEDERVLRDETGMRVEVSMGRIGEGSDT